MANNTYHFLTQWKVEGSIEEVAHILNLPLELPNWWPAVYLDVQKQVDGDTDVYHLFTKGWLPYTIKWRFVETEKELPHRIVLEASGDLEGRGTWTLSQQGEEAHVSFDWQIDAEKPLFRYFSFILKPIFSFNHHWAMRQGRKSLILELARIRSGLDRLDAPIPPLATFPHRRFYRERRKKWKTREEKTTVRI